jgi:hypothetical protein
LTFLGGIQPFDWDQTHGEPSGSSSSELFEPGDCALGIFLRSVWAWASSFWRAPAALRIVACAFEIFGDIPGFNFPSASTIPGAYMFCSTSPLSSFSESLSSEFRTSAPPAVTYDRQGSATRLFKDGSYSSSPAILAYFEPSPLQPAVTAYPWCCREGNHADRYRFRSHIAGMDFFYPVPEACSVVIEARTKTGSIFI